MSNQTKLDWISCAQLIQFTNYQLLNKQTTTTTIDEFVEYLN